MNYIKHLGAFFNRVATDDRLYPSHVSMYMSLFQCWNLNRFQNPVSITRAEIMRISKISGNATYHKCMRDLHEYGYVKYIPSYNPLRGSLVYLIDDSETKPSKKLKRTPGKRVENTPDDMFNYESNDDTCSGTCSSTGSGSGPCTSPELITVPPLNTLNIINSTNIINTKNKEINKEKEAENENAIHMFSEQEVSVAPAAADFLPPSLDEAREYFHAQGATVLDAEKFFYYFSSNGWLIGGKTPMQN